MDLKNNSTPASQASFTAREVGDRCEPYINHCVGGTFASLRPRDETLITLLEISDNIIPFIVLLYCMMRHVPIIAYAKRGTLVADGLNGLRQSMTMLRCRGYGASRNWTGRLTS